MSSASGRQRAEGTAGATVGFHKAEQAGLDSESPLAGGRTALALDFLKSTSAIMKGMGGTGRSGRAGDGDFDGIGPPGGGLSYGRSKIIGRSQRGRAGPPRWQPYTRVCCCFRVARYPPFSERNRFERQARIDYLWSRLRGAVRCGFFVRKEMLKLKMQDWGEFGLDSDCERELSDGKVLEEQLEDGEEVA